MTIPIVLNPGRLVKKAEINLSKEQCEKALLLKVVDNKFMVVLFYFGGICIF